MDSARYNDHLDQIIVFTMEPPSRMASISRKFNIQADVGVRFTERSSELTFLYHEKDPNNRDIKIYLAQFNPMLFKNSIIIRREIDAELEFNNLMKEMHSVESSVLTGISLENGIYRIVFEYAARDTKSVSSVILRFIDRIETLKLTYLGSLEDYVKSNHHSQHGSEITSLSFSIFDTGNSHHIQASPGDRRIVILKFPMGDNRVRFLVYEIHNANDKKFLSYTWEQMESESNFFGFYKSLVEKLYSSKVILIRSSQLIEEKITTFYFSFSSRQSKDFIKCLSDATSGSGIKKYRINYFESH